MVAVENPYAKETHHTSPNQAVDWVQQRWKQTRACQQPRFCLPLLLSACTVFWPSSVGASGTAKEEAGAAALLDASPLQVGFQDHGFPETTGGAVERQPSPESAPKSTGGTTPIPASTLTPSTSTPATPAQPPKGAAPRSITPARLLILDRRHRLLRVLDNGLEVRRYPVAVGMPGWETPVGSFQVIEKTANPTWEHPANGHLLPPGPENPLGSRWIGFYRDCQGRSGFNGQEHLVVKGCVTAGFHGTPNRSSVGRAVSHGCVRLFDEHAKELFELVSLGTPVKVLP